VSKDDFLTEETTMAQDQQVAPQDARTFLTSFGHAEDALKGMPDPDVLKLHGTVNGHFTKAVEEKVKAATANAPVFGEKWRETIAGDNQDAMKTLARFKDPGDIFKSYSELRAKMDAGELKFATAFPAKGTDAEKAAWRKEQGIPEAPDKYDLKFDNGLVIGADDKPIVDKYLAHAHSRNFTPDQVKENISWFLSDFKTMAEQERAEGTANLKRATEDKLREAWKGDYRMKRTAVENLLAGKVKSDSDIHKLILASVDTNADFAQFLADVALDLNPATTVVPAGDGAAGQLVNIEAEIASIEKFMRTNRADYNKDEKKQARYRDLLAAKDTMTSRQSAAR
jgi:hypothetical protein